MSQIIEFAFFAASTAYLANHNLLNQLWVNQTKPQGQIAAYNGINIEDDSTAYMIFPWESLAAFNAYQAIADPTELQDLFEVIAAPNAARPQLWFLDTAGPDPTAHAALTAPVTEIEIVTATPASRIPQGGLKPFINRLCRETDTVPGSHAPCEWGTQEGSNDSTFVIFVGWDSVQAYESKRNVLKEELVRAHLNVTTAVSKLRYSYSTPPHHGGH